MFNFQVNWGSNSGSDIEYDEGISNSIGSVNNIEIVDVIAPLSKLNLDGNNLGEAVTSSYLTSKQGSTASLEESRGIPMLLPEKIDHFCAPWRSVLSKIEVWYASYGSNMWKERFLCYIEGGKVWLLYVQPSICP